MLIFNLSATIHSRWVSTCILIIVDITQWMGCMRCAPSMRWMTQGWNLSAAFTRCFFVWDKNLIWPLSLKSSKLWQATLLTIDHMYSWVQELNIQFSTWNKENTCVFGGVIQIVNINWLSATFQTVDCEYNENKDQEILCSIQHAKCCLKNVNQ